MNLALLDPFRRQLPDRIVSTFNLPRSFHPVPLIHHDTAKSSSSPLLPVSPLPSSPSSKKVSKQLLDKEEIEDQHEKCDEEDQLSDSSVKNPDDEDEDEDYDDGGGSASMCVGDGDGNRDDDDENRESCLATCFHRRGLYLATSYQSGAVAVFDFMTRRLVALFHPTSHINDQQQNSQLQRGITSLSWSRRSRRLVCASAETPYIYLLNNAHPTHPHWSPRYKTWPPTHPPPKTSSPSNENSALTTSSKHLKHKNKDKHSPTKSKFIKDSNKTNTNTPTNTTGASLTESDESSLSQIITKMASTLHPYQLLPVQCYKSLTLVPAHNDEHNADQEKESRRNIPLTFEWNIYPSNMEMNPFPNLPKVQQKELKQKSFQNLILSLPIPIAKDGLRTHPYDSHLGLAIATDGSLLMYSFPPTTKDPTTVGWAKVFPLICSLELSNRPSLFTLPQHQNPLESNALSNEEKNNPYSVTCATFNKEGNCIFAGTHYGRLLLFDLTYSDENIVLSPNQPTHEIKKITASPGNTITDIVISPNGHSVVINSKDGILRLFSVSNLMQRFHSNSSTTPTPEVIFQDPMNKHIWKSPTFSGDSENLLAGCNPKIKQSKEDCQYKIYIWNITNGSLCDVLSGPQTISMTDIASHPTRTFLGIATSDGLMDIWGPRMDWTAFAPDFQAMTNNVEYMEMEDEFDTVINDDDNDPHDHHKENDSTDISEGNQSPHLKQQDNQDMTMEDVTSSEPILTTKSVHVNPTNTSNKKEKSEQQQQQQQNSHHDDVHVDVVSVDKVPMFDSDSEEEEEVFWFDNAKVTNLLNYGKQNSENNNKLLGCEKGDRKRKHIEEEE